MTFAALSGYEKMIAAAEDETKARPEVIEFGFVETLTDDTPRQAIIGAWGLLEYELNIAADQLAPDQPHGWPQVARTLDAWDKWPLLYPAVMELRRLRDYTARSGQPPSSEDATRYVSVASELAATVRAAFTPASGDARSGAE